MKKIKVRFNLSKGINFMKWKISYPEGHSKYLNPNEVQLVLKNCTLKNYKKVAEKIFNGAEKSVFAWVLCENIYVKNNPCILNNSKLKKVNYNPRVAPNWEFNGFNSDGLKFDALISINSGLYVKTKTKKPVQIEMQEWWYKGCFIQKQIHPQLARYVIFADTEGQEHIDTAHTFNEAKKIASNNEVKNYKLGVESFGF